jgi:hypothetical protein
MLDRGLSTAGIPLKACQHAATAMRTGIAVFHLTRTRGTYRASPAFLTSVRVASRRDPRVAGAVGAEVRDDLHTRPDRLTGTRHLHRSAPTTVAGRR